MKISVIIPTYKPQDYIWKCLDTLICQTLSKNEYEIIIVLNGCDQPWKDDIQRYLDTMMDGIQFKFFQTMNGGVSNARNIALDCAEGDYICFVDDDDYVSSTYLEELCRLADNNTIVLSNTIAFHNDAPDVPIRYHVSEVYNNFYKRTSIAIYSRVRTYFSGPCMKLIHRDIIGNMRFDNRLTNGEDSVFMFQISNKVKNIVFASPNVVYYRRFRDNSALTRRRSRLEKIKNSMLCIKLYIITYFKGGYNLWFFLSRLCAEIRSNL